MPFRNPTLEKDDQIPNEVYAAIASAQLEHHPFKDRSASLADLMRVMHDIRALPSPQYNACVRGVLETVMNISDQGCHCYGRGLVLLRHITVGLDETLYTVGTKLLEAETHICLPSDDSEVRRAPSYETEFMHRLEQLGIRPVDEYGWVGEFS